MVSSLSYGESQTTLSHNGDMKKHLTETKTFNTSKLIYFSQFEDRTLFVFFLLIHADF